MAAPKPTQQVSKLLEEEEEKSRAEMEESNPPNQDGNGILAELWRACAGPLITIPSVGEKVFYFPQGHIEQVEAYANQDGGRQMPIYGLPSKILCRVVNVQLKAERETDEVFAQLTLLPEHEEQSTTPTGPQDVSASNPRVQSFCKILTASDTSTHGGFSILKRHAEDCLPPLDMSQQPPVQTLVARDLHGAEWTFRHIFRGQPKRHLLTTGWSTFVCSKKLVAGDAFIFLRGENGELYVGVRRAMKKQGHPSAAVISSQSMQLGILAAASHAITSGTMFNVYYWPRKSPGFVIPYDQYMDTLKKDYPIGMRFQMKFEGDDGQEERLTGTIVGKEDCEPTSWPDSKWRCFKIQWDEMPAALYPERISPWQIIPFTPAAVQPQIALRPKRMRRTHLQSPPKLSGSSAAGPSKVPVHPTPRCSGVLQGQESTALGLGSSCALTEPGNLPEFSSLYSMPPQTPNAEGSDSIFHRQQMESENSLYSLKHKAPSLQTYYSNSNATRISETPGGLNSYCHYDNPAPSIIHNPDATKNLEKPMYEYSAVDTNLHMVHKHAFQEMVPLNHNQAASRATDKVGNGTVCKIFGVDLIKSPSHSMLAHAATSAELQGAVPVTQPQLLTYDHDQLSEPSKSTRPTESGVSGSLYEQSSASQILHVRSCTKVHKQGTALGRSVDLSRFDGYEELINELDKMFEFQGSLVDQTKGWKVIYTDEEGDIMMIGDYPWQEFCAMVRRIYIYTQEEVEKLKPGMLMA